MILGVLMLVLVVGLIASMALWAVLWIGGVA